MKNFLFLLIIISVSLQIIICENEKDKKENEQFKQMVNYHIETIGYKDRKEITRDEFRKLFLKIFENKSKDSQESREDLDIIFSLTNALFDFIVNEKIHKIKMDEIYNYFEPNVIVNALKGLLKQLGMEKLIDSISESFMETLKGNENKDNINDGTNDINNKDKNSDL